MQDHFVPHRDIGHRSTHGVHPTGVLVADGVGQVHPGLLLPLAFENVQIGATHPRPTDTDDDVQRSLHDRFGDLLQLQLGVVPDHLDRPHGSSFVLLSTILGMTVAPSS